MFNYEVNTPIRRHCFYFNPCYKDSSKKAYHTDTATAVFPESDSLI